MHSLDCREETQPEGLSPLLFLFQWVLHSLSLSISLLHYSSVVQSQHISDMLNYPGWARRDEREVRSEIGIEELLMDMKAKRGFDKRGEGDKESRTGHAWDKGGQNVWQGGRRGRKRKRGQRQVGTMPQSFMVYRCIYYLTALIARMQAAGQRAV